MELPLTAFRNTHSALVAELFAASGAAELSLDRETFSGALWRSAQKAGIAEAKLSAYLRSLRVGDLALAAACAAGSEGAWKKLFDTMRGPLCAAGRAMAGD